MNPSVDEEGDIQTSTNTGEVEKVISDLLRGTFVTAHQYAAGFRVELSREGRPPHPFIPMVVWLTLRSSWRVGSENEWQSMLSSAPWPTLDGEVNDPMRAYALAWLAGAEITDMSLTEGGELHLVTARGKDLVLSGTDEVFEESWIVDSPQDVPNSEYWSVVCDNAGLVCARFPRRARRAPTRASFRST